MDPTDALCGGRGYSASMNNRCMFLCESVRAIMGGARVAALQAAHDKARLLQKCGMQL